MKINQLDIDKIIEKSKPKFNKLSNMSLLYYISFVLLLIVVFIILKIFKTGPIQLLIGVSIMIVGVIWVLSLFTNIYSLISRKYKKIILLPILQQIDGFDNYNFKSRDYRTQIKFQLDKPLGYQLLFSNDYNLDAAGYYSIELSRFNPYYSLFNNACVDESTHIALSNLYKSLQNAVQISRMIRAADKFVDSYNNLNIATR